MEKCGWVNQKWCKPLDTTCLSDWTNRLLTEKVAKKTYKTLKLERFLSCVWSMVRSLNNYNTINGGLRSKGVQLSTQYTRLPSLVNLVLIIMLPHFKFPLILKCWLRVYTADLMSPRPCVTTHYLYSIHWKIMVRRASWPLLRHTHGLLHIGAMFST